MTEPVGTASSTYFFVLACKSVVGAGTIGEEVNVLTSAISSAPVKLTLPSAYNFLYTNKEDYPEWIFKVKYDKDIFSL